MTDFLDSLERQLVTAAAAPAGLRRPAARRVRRVTPVVVAFVVLVLTAAVALAASGLLNGSPVRPSGPLSPTVGDGIPAPGGSRLLSLRVADPAGGLPWGLRIVHTTRGYVCLQVGRVQNGELGELGIDGAFNDDGRFHPLPADVLPATGPAYPSSCVLPGQTFSTTQINYDRNASPPNGKVPAAADRRLMAFGLLGRHALRVTYRNGTRQRTTAAAPGSGAFLVVERNTIPALGTGQGVVGSQGFAGQRPVPNGALTAFTYRFGSTVCSDSRSPNAANACPRQKINIRQSPSRDLHRPLHVTLTIKDHLIYGARLTFVAPYAVNSAQDSYELEMTTRAGCHGTGGVELGSAVNRNISRGATITINIPYPFANSCGSSQAIGIVFRRLAQPLKPIRIGSLTIHEPAGTRGAQPPTRRPNPTK